MADHEAPCGHEECADRAHQLEEMTKFIDSFADLDRIRNVDESTKLALWSAGHLAGVASSAANALLGSVASAQDKAAIDGEEADRLRSEIEEFVTDRSIVETYRALSDPAIRQHILASFDGVERAEAFFDKISLPPVD